MKHILLCFLFLILVNLLNHTSNATASPIINGIPDDLHQFKFHVFIHRKQGPANEFSCSCGGSIISERYILTAAHCFMTLDNRGMQEIFYPHGTTKIIAGTNHRNGPGIERDIIRVFIPSVLGSRSYPADLAVAELNADLGVHEHPDRLAIMLLEALNPRSNAGVNQLARFCGSGYDILVRQRDRQFSPARSDSTINKFMNVRILGRDECPLFEKWICARNSDERPFRTACFGDSGSGLVSDNKIVGVLKTGPTNCNNLIPIIFTRLFGFMEFIAEAQNPRGNHRNMHVLDERPRSSEYPRRGQHSG